MAGSGLRQDTACLAGVVVDGTPDDGPEEGNDMSHNYATPMTPEKRLVRVLSRIPADWVIKVERHPGQDGDMLWRAVVAPTDADAGQDGSVRWCADHPAMVDALEAAWRHARQHFAQ